MKSRAKDDMLVLGESFDLLIKVMTFIDQGSERPVLKVTCTLWCLIVRTGSFLLVLYELVVIAVILIIVVGVGRMDSPGGVPGESVEEGVLWDEMPIDGQVQLLPQVVQLNGLHVQLLLISC